MMPLPIADCHGCGVCCLHMGYPAFNLSDAQLLGTDSVETRLLSPSAMADWDRWNAMPDELRNGIRHSIREHKPSKDGQLDGACVWLDAESKLCQNHTHRPQVCRDFEVGASGCREWRKAYDV